MMSKLFKRDLFGKLHLLGWTHLVVLAFLVTSWSSAALSQSLPDSGDSSPPHVSIADDNGVNFWSSDVTYPMPSLAIGVKDSASSLGFSAVWQGARFGHNFLCYAFTWQYVGTGGHRTGEPIGWEVVCNNRLTQFLAPGKGAGGVNNSQGSGFLNAAPNGGGETLTQVSTIDGTINNLYPLSNYGVSAGAIKLVYTDRSGVQTTFTIPPNEIYTPPSTTAYGGGQWVYSGQLSNYPIYLASGTTYPSGYSVNYTYTTNISTINSGGGVFYGYYSLLQSVNSNTGMQFKFNYPTTINLQNTDDGLIYFSGNWGIWNAPDDDTYSVTAIDNAQEYCDPSAATCSFAKNWQSVSFATNRNPSVYGVTLVTATDALRNATQYNLGPAPYSDPFWLITPQVLNSITSPGGLDNITIQRTFYDAPTTITRNGVTTNYTWQNRPGPTICNQYGCPGIFNTTQQVVVNRGGLYSATYNTAGNPPQITVSLGYLTSVADGAGNTTNYSLGCEGNPGSVQYPQGNQTVFAFDGRCNLVSTTQMPKPGSGLANIVTSAGYDATCTLPAKCNKPNWVQDAYGHETDFTYTAWGALASAMRPAPFAGAARPLKLYTYQQLSANILNPSGVLTSSGQPIWVPATEVECQTAAGSSALSCDPGAAQTTTSYLYGAASSPDNLWPRGKQVSGGGVTLTSCYSYDQWGRRVSETAPNANLTTCP